MIDGVQSCKIKPGDIIGVENHDRLTRRPPLEAIELFIAFLNAGIVLDINGNIRTKEILNAALGFGLLVQDLIEMFRAYQESQRKSEFGIKTNLSKRESARNGERRVMKAGAGCFVGRRCPAWLRALTMPSPEGYLYAIIPDAPDQPWRSIARRAFLMADAGHGVGTISRRFNDDRVPPLETAHRLSANPNQRRKKRPVSIKWTAGMVWQLLRNPAVVGEYHPCVVRDGKRGDGGPPIRGYYPPLFPDDLCIFYRVRDAMRARDKAGGKGRNGRNYANIIKGIARCACCDGTLTLHTSSGRVKGEGSGREVVYYLRCDNARQGVIFPERHKLAGLKQEREERQERVKAGEASNPIVMAVRVRAARAMLATNDPQERYDARVKVHDLLRDRIAVRLHQDRKIVVIMKGFDPNGDMLGVRFTPDGVLHVHKVSEGCTKLKCQLTPDELR